MSSTCQRLQTWYSSQVESSSADALTTEVELLCCVCKDLQDFVMYIKHVIRVAGYPEDLTGTAP